MARLPARLHFLEDWNDIHGRPHGMQVALHIEARERVGGLAGDGFACLSADGGFRTGPSVAVVATHRAGLHVLRAPVDLRY